MFCEVNVSVFNTTVRFLTRHQLLFGNDTDIFLQIWFEPFNDIP